MWNLEPFRRHLICWSVAQRGPSSYKTRLDHYSYHTMSYCYNICTRICTACRIYGGNMLGSWILAVRGKADRGSTSTVQHVALYTKRARYMNPECLQPCSRVKLAAHAVQHCSLNMPAPHFRPRACASGA